MKILTCIEIKQWDKFTMVHEPIRSVDLMERAAREIAAAIARRWDKERLIILFAGPGNNGGDTLAVARLLSQQGYETQTFLFNINNKLSPDCAINKERLLDECPDAVFNEVTTKFNPPTLMEGDVVVDGLFGSGLNKPLTGGFAAVVKYINNSRAQVVSIDVPSGLMCEDNSYNLPAHIIHADVTLTLQLPKLAFFFPENQAYTGEVETLDIQLHPEGLEEAETDYFLTQEGDLTLKPRNRFAHKGDFGRALLIAGRYGMAGAAVLAAKATLRSGVGLLTVHTPLLNNDILQTAVPEAIMEHDADEFCFSTAVEEGAFSAVAIGPGIGLHPQTAEAMEKQLTYTHSSPLVLDADALNLLAQHKEWLPLLPEETILTPHPKEFDRIVGASANAYERLQKARELAMDYRLFIILKGAYTAVVTPEGQVHFNPTGNPGMATAGSGDVLTGILLATLAQGYPPLDACRLAVYVHGLAGDIAAERLGETAMVASDIIAHLPQAWKQMTKR